MSIVSSQIVEDSAQKDTRRWIRERHVDQVGVFWEFAYLCVAAFDAAAAMAARVSDINAFLIANEIASNISAVVTLGSGASPTLVHSTVAQNAAALRAAYAIATNLQSVMVADFLNTLTNGQIATAFGITTGQAATLRTNKLAPAAALAASLHASVGA